MLDSCEPEIGGLPPELAADPGGAEGAEMAGVLPGLLASPKREAMAAPEGAANAALGKAGDADNAAEAGNNASPLTRPAAGAAAGALYIEQPAETPAVAAMNQDAAGNSTSHIGDTIPAAADICVSAGAPDNASAGRAFDQCVIRRLGLGAASTAGEACNIEVPRPEEAHSKCTEMKMPVEISAPAAASTGLEDTVSTAFLDVLDSSQAKTQQCEDSAAAMPARQAAAGQGETGAHATLTEGGPSQGF